MKSCLIFVMLGAEFHEVFAFTIHVPKGPRCQTTMKSNSQNPKLEFSVSGAPAGEFGVRVWMEKQTTRQGLEDQGWWHCGTSSRPNVSGIIHNGYGLRMGKLPFIYLLCSFGREMSYIKILKGNTPKMLTVIISWWRDYG